MKRKGPKHTFAERVLMKQVASEFEKKMKEIGAKEAAKQLRVSVPSFYNYASGTDLPRIEVLLMANKKWGIEWERLAPQDILQTRKAPSAKQLAFSFLDKLRDEDVEITEVGTEGETVLRLALKVRFPV